MTDSTDSTETTTHDPSLEGTAGDGGTTEDPALEATETGTGNKEAAKWRRKLRDTEGERDTLRNQVTAMQRGEAERLATSHLANGPDLWLGEEIDLSALLDDAGAVDPAKVQAACRSLTEQRPHWGRPGAVKAGTLRSGAGADPGPAPDKWAGAFVSSRRKQRLPTAPGEG